MPSAFEQWAGRLEPARFVLAAIVGSVIGIVLLLSFILLRRALRRRHFRRRDERARWARAHWEDIVSGEIPTRDWLEDRLRLDVVQTLLIDQIETARDDERERLQRCLARSGLLDRRIAEARRLRGWRRRQALVLLGRTRVPETIPALSEALDDTSAESRLAALRGLGRMALPAAAGPILDRLLDGRLQAPYYSIQNALLCCTKNEPQILLPYLRQAAPETRAMLARVLGEVATGKLNEDLLLLACDTQAEVRASAARSLGEARFSVALSALGALTEDQEWFVRLRAVVALGQMKQARAIPTLVNALCDPNRFVRLRSAMALAQLRGDLERILDLAAERKDNYAMQALISELERSGAVLELVDQLDTRSRARAQRLLGTIVRFGAHRLLVSALAQHRRARVREAIAKVLGRSRERVLAPLLHHAWETSTDLEVRQLTQRVLVEIQEEPAPAPQRARRRLAS